MIDVEIKVAALLGVFLLGYILGFWTRGDE
jgi:hypothetical protein